MSAAASLRDSVAAFARLRASLDDPFADRGALLQAAGIDEAQLAHLAEEHAARLLADPASREVYCREYAAARARASGAGEPVDETAAIDLGLLFTPVIPFGGGPGSRLPESTGEPHGAGPACSGDTLSDPAGTVRRLVRFDPQTGEPLPEARWEEIPAPAPAWRRLPDSP